MFCFTVNFSLVVPGITSDLCFSREGYRICLGNVLVGKMILNVSPEVRKETKGKDYNSMLFKFE